MLIKSVVTSVFIFVASSCFVSAKETTSASNYQIALNKNLIFEYVLQNSVEISLDIAEQISVILHLDNFSKTNPDWKSFRKTFEFYELYLSFKYKKLPSNDHGANNKQNVIIVVAKDAFAKARNGEFHFQLKYDQNQNPNTVCYLEGVEKEQQQDVIIISESEYHVNNCIHFGMLRALGLSKTFWKFLDEKEHTYTKHSLIFLKNAEMTAIMIVQKCKSHFFNKAKFRECLAKALKL